MAWFALFTRGANGFYLCSCHGERRTPSYSLVSLWYSIQLGSICIGQKLKADNKQITGGTKHVSTTLPLDCFAALQANVMLDYTGLLIVVTL